MKKENSPEETFLSDWMAGKLSDEQLQELVSKVDFIAYKKLKHSMQTLQLSDPDMQRNYAAIKEKRIAALNNQKPTKVFSLYRYAAIAATIVLLFGLFQLFIYTNTIVTDFGASTKVALNDNSHVTLNAKSKLTYPNFFKYHRSLQLEGEAYFEVEKGSTFIVETPQGKVEVVGTKFNVIARPAFFEVICFEGKVKVSTTTQTKIITRGNAVRFYQNQIETWKETTSQKPLWITGESSFKNLPLQLVINQFQYQYHCNVTYPLALQHIRFSGSFSNKDVAIALQSICIPLHLNYVKTKTGEIRISE
jgi:ferric-dicitrate binding protein FerR (iron transport regulator)